MTSDAAPRTATERHEQPTAHVPAARHTPAGGGPHPNKPSADQPTKPDRTDPHTGPDAPTADESTGDRHERTDQPAGSLVATAPGVRAADDHAAEHSSERSPVGAGAGRPSAAMSAAGDLLRALAAPVRIAIVLELREHDRCVHELVEALGVAQPLISQHLRVLKSAGVVHGERHGREVVYSLVDEHLAHIVVDAVAHVEEGS